MDKTSLNGFKPFGIYAEFVPICPCSMAPSQLVYGGGGWMFMYLLIF